MAWTHASAWTTVISWDTVVHVYKHKAINRYNAKNTERYFKHSCMPLLIFKDI